MCFGYGLNYIKPMGILLIVLGCLLLYSRSKYFPAALEKIFGSFRGKPGVLRIVAYLFFVASAIILMVGYGPATGLLIFLITLMFALCLIIMFLPLNKKYAYLLVGLSLLFIIIENSL